VIRTGQAGKPAPHERTPRLAGLDGVLKNRNFLLLWLAQLISLTVFNAANFGLIVLVNNQTHSVIMVGLAIVTFTLPAIPFSAIAGVIVDRLNKRLVLWVSNVLRMATMLLIFVSRIYDHSSLWPLFVLIFITSLIGQFFVPAEGSAIPLLVGERDLLPALSLFNITLTLAQAIGFLLLGRIVATIFPPFMLHLESLTFAIQSIDMLFVVVAAFYAVCAVLILCIPARAFDQPHLHKHSRDGAPVEASKALEGLWHDIVDGWQIVRTDRLLFFAVVQFSVVGYVMQLISEIAGPFVQQILHRPVEDMSIILAPAAVGLVGASLLMTRITERVEKMILTITGFVVFAVGFLLLPACQWLALYLDPRHGATSPWLLWTTVLLVFLLGVAMACVNIPTQLVMQERAPESGRGRVLALQFMLYNAGSIPILLFAGVIAQFIGLNPLILLISASILLFCWWGAHFVKGNKLSLKKAS